MLRNPYAIAKRNNHGKPGHVENASNTSHMGEDTSNVARIKSSSLPETCHPKQAYRTMKDSSGGRTGSMYWQRLPSQNLSFGSSEILTVGECITHSTLYQGRCIRTTGILQTRNCDGEAGTVVLELSDPVAKPERSCSTTKTPLKRPLQVRPKTMQKPGFIRKRKRPWFHGAPKLKSAAPAAPSKRLKVLVGVEHSCLDELSVGSTVVMVIGTILQNGYVQARIVQRMKSFDMTFYTNALMARRKLIFQKHQILANQPPNQEQLPVEQSAPIHGCGPPPYGNFLTNG